jgi:hypothetical protein
VVLGRVLKPSNTKPTPFIPWKPFGESISSRQTAVLHRVSSTFQIPSSYLLPSTLFSYRYPNALDVLRQAAVFSARSLKVLLVATHCVYASRSDSFCHRYRQTVPRREVNVGRRYSTIGPQSSLAIAMSHGRLKELYSENTPDLLRDTPSDQRQGVLP